MKKVEAYLFALFTNGEKDSRTSYRLLRRWRPLCVYFEESWDRLAHFPTVPIGVLVAFDRRHPGVIEAAPAPGSRYAASVLPQIDASKAAAAIDAALRSANAQNPKN